MKKAFVLILSVFPMIASGDYLDDKIADLTKQKLEKIAELEECQKSTKGLKIAGITTLGISTVGIAANIGEAVALKKLDGQISEAETKLGDLDEQIQDKKAENERKEQQANTCGVQQCNLEEKDAKIATLNAKTVVCVNGAWVPSACEDGFSGTTATCTLNSEIVTYYMSCKQDAKTCEQITDEWLNQNNAKSGACDKIIVQNYITECKENYVGIARVAGNKQGYKKCQKKQVQEKTCDTITDAWLNQNNAKSAACDTTIVQNYITECKDGFTGTERTSGNKQGHGVCQKNEGGDATTTIKDCPRTIPPVNYVLNCEGMCQQYAQKNNCKLNESLDGPAGCICNPSFFDKRSFGSNTGVEDKGDAIPPSAPVEEDNIQTVVYYKRINSMVVQATFEGKSYQGEGTGWDNPTKRKRSLEDLNKQLVDAGYKNVILVESE